MFDRIFNPRSRDVNSLNFPSGSIGIQNLIMLVSVLPAQITKNFFDLVL
jgi:hypothetical protein